MEALEALIPLLLILAAAVPKIKKSSWKKKAEEIRRAVVTAVPLDNAPDMRPMPPPSPVVESVPPSPEPAEEKQVFPSGFVSLPASLASMPEGVDPCHDDMYTDAEADDVQIRNVPTGAPQLSQEWVRGVVMGEILSAPKYKAFVRK